MTTTKESLYYLWSNTEIAEGVNTEEFSVDAYIMILFNKKLDINNTNTVVELRDAQNYQVYMFGFKLAVVGGLLGMLIGGPIGFVVLGTKIATGIGATTCGVVGLIGGNRVSENYRETDTENINRNN